jgi:hypothetical protein
MKNFIDYIQKLVSSGIIYPQICHGILPKVYRNGSAHRALPV